MSVYRYYAIFVRTLRVTIIKSGRKMANGIPTNGTPVALITSRMLAY